MAGKLLAGSISRWALVPAAALALGAGALGALAQTSGTGAVEQRAFRFELVDWDGDGVISADEAARRHEEVFTLIDADADGALTLAEYLSVRFGRGAEGGANREEMDKHKSVRFESMDADDDKRVRKTEFMAAGEKQHGAADTNGDGKVSIWEYRAARQF